MTLLQTGIVLTIAIGLSHIALYANAIRVRTVEHNHERRH